MKTPIARLVCLVITAAICADHGRAQTAIVDLETHSWNYMHPQDFTDPAIADTDFDTTWMLSDAAFNVQYDGLSFTSDTATSRGGSGAGVFGYGDIRFRDQHDVDITAPAIGSRGTAYFRSTFSVPTPEDPFVPGSFNLDLLADAGAVVYLDGAPLVVLNCCDPNSDNYASTSITFGSDSALTNYSIDDLTPGSTHTLAVSVHKVFATSSGLSFALGLSAQTSTPQFGDIVLGNNNVLGTGFEEPDIGATDYVRGTNAPGNEIGFVGKAGSSASIQDEAGGKQYHINFGNVDLMTEFIDLRETTSDVMVSVDVRAWESSGTSNFESTDSIRVFVEASNDGVTFTEIDVLPTVTGGSPDGLKALEIAPGGADTPFTNFSTNISAGSFSTLRVGVTAINNSPSERIAFDNIRISSVPEPSTLTLFGGIAIAMLGCGTRRRYSAWATRRAEPK